MPLPFVTCLCPTYQRPRLLDKSIQMFLSQDYPADRRELLIFDDSDSAAWLDRDSTLVRYYWFQNRFKSMPEKYNEMLKLALGDVLVVWDDDDLYKPWHISAHVNTTKYGRFSKPSMVESDYTGNVELEDASGRFHGSIAFQRGPKWPETNSETFDQMMIAKLGMPMDTLSANPNPSYRFQWHTGHYHMQNAMGAPGWYEKLPEIAKARLQ